MRMNRNTKERLKLYAIQKLKTKSRPRVAFINWLIDNSIKPADYIKKNDRTPLIDSDDYYVVVATQQKMCRETGLAISTINKTLNELCEGRPTFIERETKGVYRIHLNALFM